MTAAKRGTLQAACLLTLALVLTVAPRLLADDDSEPLREEDVVRMFVGGVPTAEILEAIRVRSAAYELSDEMQRELALAGVPAELVRAMLARKQELEPQPEPTEVTEPVEEARGPVVRILLNPDRNDGGSVLRLRGEVDPRVREHLQLRADDEGKPFEDLAVFLICRTSVHVPDQWRSRSPMGRDFISMPRHEMLAFISGARGDDSASGPPMLELELPRSIEVELDPDGVHDLSLGLAIQTAGRYYRIVSDERDAVVVTNRGTTFGAVIEGSKDGQAAALSVRLLDAVETE